MAVGFRTVIADHSLKGNGMGAETPGELLRETFYLHIAELPDGQYKPDQEGWEEIAKSFLTHANPWLDRPDGPGQWLVARPDGSYFVDDIDQRHLGDGNPLFPSWGKGKKFQRIIGPEKDDQSLPEE